MAQLDNKENSASLNETTSSSPDELHTESLPNCSKSVALGCEDVRFNLKSLYTGLNDPSIELDLLTVEKLYQDFSNCFKGRLSTELGAAIDALETITRLSAKLTGYSELLKSCDVENQLIQNLAAQINERLMVAMGDYYSFFEIEIGALDSEQYQSLLRKDPRVKRYETYITQIRDVSKHLLSEDVERAIALREPFGVSEWEEYYYETLSKSRFLMASKIFEGESFYQQSISQAEILHVINSHPRREVKAEALSILNNGAEENIVPLMSRILNVVAGKKNIEDRERGYAHTMAERNMSNLVPDKVVESLHSAVCDKGAELCQRYYRLVAKQIGVEKLDWSDRIPSLRGSSQQVIPWSDALSLVKSAFHSFSPTLANLVEEVIEAGWIDAPYYEGKDSGAFNQTIVLPEGEGVASYVFLNYLGTPRDVATLAHELGHAVHGLLAGRKLGALMYDAPIAYCETASIFAEMVTFEYLKNKVKDPVERLDLLMAKIGDFMNSVVRQISFSLFEKMLHEDRKEEKLTSEKLCENWMSVTKLLYGEQGEIFNYRDMNNLWSYIPHFLSPYYVYGYAFGELLTQSLYAVKETMGESFDPLFVEMLSAGGTEDAVDLLKRYNQSALDPSFWVKGIEVSAGRWIAEAEQLFDEIARDGGLRYSESRAL